MKLLLISNMYPSAKYPHYGVFVENAEKILRQLPGVTLCKAVMPKRDGKFAKLMGYLGFYAKILWLGLFGGYDVLYGHFISHISLPLRIVKVLKPKITLVLNAHGNDVVADTSADDKWVAMSRKVVPCADYVIVPSAYFKAVMKDRFGVPEEKLLVYPSGGVDPRVFFPQKREALVEKYKLDPDKRYVGYISRIETDKGWDTFLHMVAALCHREELGFVVVGGGKEEPAFDALARQLGIGDKLIRYPLLSQKEISELYNILDVFCFPTRRKSESLGLVGLEAIACGCLVVASDAGGPSSYMKDGENGLVFTAGSAEALTQKVTEALALTPEEKAVLQAGMTQTAAAYSRQTLDKILLDFFADLQKTDK